MTRLADWEARLRAVGEKHLATPAEWGVSDCVLAMADAVEAVTGEDPAARIRGKYSTEAGAAKLIRKNGHDDVEGILETRWNEINRLQAKRGDIGFIERDGMKICGWFTEYGFAVKTEPGHAAGLAYVSTMEVKRAFEVA